MATKKGLCLKCTSKRIDHRIFQVNPEASTCFCPICMKEMEPKEAINNYLKFIKDMLSKADNTLFVAFDPSLAYQQYADVLELEPYEAHALIGRILCLVYMGKVRKSYLKEAYVLLENTSYKGCDIQTFVSFLEKINTALDEYDQAVNKRLTIKGYYYDDECLRLYWSHLTDIVKMKELILSTIKKIKKTEKNADLDSAIETLEVSIDEKKRILDLESFTADGCGYHLDHYFNNRPFLVKTSQETSNKFKRYRLSTLDPEDKKKLLIKDQIFEDYTVIIKLQKIAIFFWILLFAFVGGAIAGAILLKEKVIFLWLFVSLAIVFFMVASILFAFSLKWRAVLKKRELKIN